MDKIHKVYEAMALRIQQMFRDIFLKRSGSIMNPLRSRSWRSSLK